MKTVFAASLLYAMVMVLLAACSLPTASTESQLVTSLRFSPSAFDSFRRNTQIQYTLKSPADVTVSIIRRTEAGMDIPVRALFGGLSETRGAHSHAWLGDTDQGQFAPTGDYVGVVEVQGKRFEAVVRVFHY